MDKKEQTLYLFDLYIISHRERKIWKINEQFHLYFFPVALCEECFNLLGEVQNLEWSNVERPILRNFKITNIKIAKEELFDDFIFNLFFDILEIIWTRKIFNNFWYCKILIFQIVKF